MHRAGRRWGGSWFGFAAFPMRSARAGLGVAELVCVALLGTAGAGCAAASTAPSAAPRVAPEPEVRSSVGEVHKRGTGKLIAEVGPRGGTLELSNGARLAIPAGALSEVVEITIAEGARTTAFSNHEYERPIGPIVEVSPEISLNTPATISVPLAALPDGFSAADLSIGVETVSDAQRAVQGAATQTRWDYLGASSSSGRASAELPALPGYRVQFLVSRSN
jgi:hypothetical protein